MIAGNAVLASFSFQDPDLIDACYLVAGIAFILGIKRLSSPVTARSGNIIASVGMLVAVVATLLDQEIVSFGLIAVGIAVGTVIGVVSARMVKMTAMPQMVALFNGVGGGAAALIAVSEYHRLAPAVASIEVKTLITLTLSVLIGSISFAGSMVAFAKLQELMTGRPIVFPGQKVVNGAFGAVAIFLIVYLIAGPESETLVAILLGLALLLGVMLVIPIGGADMPVVISLLNAFTGLAAALSGFTLHNNVLIIAGSLVGSSGTLLTILMGRAMNRPVTNVLFGAFGGGPSGVGRTVDADRNVRSGTPQDAAILMAYGRSVIMVPGYGLAVAQAQHNLREVGDMLERKGIDVKYAIHPVAGRMPGHMNVLLAEADVPYPQLYDMDDINPEFSHTDVALVVGANDVTNPAAKNDPDSPIAGMPILEVDQAENVIVLKRSMNPGFAGIDNELYYDPKTMMVFGDAKETLGDIIAEIGNL